MNLGGILVNRLKTRWLAMRTYTTAAIVIRFVDTYLYTDTYLGTYRYTNLPGTMPKDEKISTNGCNYEAERRQLLVRLYIPQATVFLSATRGFCKLNPSMMQV
jgi:hypothetical protein